MNTRELDELKLNAEILVCDSLGVWNRVKYKSYYKGEKNQTVVVYSDPKTFQVGLVDADLTKEIPDEEADYMIMLTKKQVEGIQFNMRRAFNNIYYEKFVSQSQEEVDKHSVEATEAMYEVLAKLVRGIEHG